MKTIVLPVVFALVTVALHGQQGLVIISEAMQRAAAWKDVANVSYTSLQTSYNKWQSYDYYNPSGNKNVLRFFYDLKNSRYFYTADSYYGGGYHFSFANIGKDSMRYIFDQIGNRDGKKVSRQGKAQFIAGTSFLQQFIPYFLLKNLSAKNDSLYVVQDGNHTIVRRNLKPGGFESYYFNAERQLVRQVIGNNAQQTERVFRNYINAGGLTYASIIDSYVNGALLTHDSVYNVTTEQLHESKLQLPAGYMIDTALAAPKVTALSGHTYLVENVPGGRNMLFVELKEGIFVTEAPLSAEVSQAMIDIIHKTLPGKPIKYVHLSHFHNDHTNGIRAFAAEGATIVAAEYTIGVIRTIVDDTSGRFKDRFAAMNTPANFLSLTSFNENTIKLHELQNDHAKGMSFVYLPSERIVYEGDLYTLPDDGTITPAIDITRKFYQYLKKNKIDVSRIIGHHGNANITPAILKAAVRAKNKQQ